MAQFSVDDAKTNLAMLIAITLAGGDVVIVKGGVPVVRLVPVATVGHRRFGALKGKIGIDAHFDEPLPDNELGAWKTV